MLKNRCFFFDNIHGFFFLDFLLCFYTPSRNHPIVRECILVSLFHLLNGWYIYTSFFFLFLVRRGGRWALPRINRTHTNSWGNGGGWKKKKKEKLLSIYIKYYKREKERERDRQYRAEIVLAEGDSDRFHYKFGWIKRLYTTDWKLTAIRNNLKLKRFQP